jgi:Fur family peroxide stress response transcriptional regulator
LTVSNLDIVTQALAAKGLKITHQRIVVYKELMSSVKHPTAEQIYEKIKKKNPSISLATVYKILETFVENHLINRVSTPRGSMRYDPRIDYHNHIYVSNTDEIMDYEDDELREMLIEYLKKRKFNNLNITDFKLQIRGEKIDTKKEINIS